MLDKIFSLKTEIKQKEGQIMNLEAEMEAINEHVVLMKLTSGQSFGELALITSKPRSANIVCE